MVPMYFFQQNQRLTGLLEMSDTLSPDATASMLSRLTVTVREWEYSLHNIHIHILCISSHPSMDARFQF